MRIVKQPTVIRAGIKKVVHVNGAVIRANKRDATDRPVYTVQSADGVLYGREVVFTGPVTAVQNFAKPRSNGAVAWLETRGEVEVRP